MTPDKVRDHEFRYACPGGTLCVICGEDHRSDPWPPRQPVRDRLLVWVAGRVLTMCTHPTRRRLAAALRPHPVPVTDDDY